MMRWDGPKQGAWAERTTDVGGVMQERKGTHGSTCLQGLCDNKAHAIVDGWERGEGVHLGSVHMASIRGDLR